MEGHHLELTPDKLRWRCDQKAFSFRCTDELVPLQEFVGQVRAIGAIEFGLGVEQPGYNIFVTGLGGTGKSTIVKQHLEDVVAKKIAAGTAASPPDWCYLFNFADTDKPNIVKLPAGKGREFKAKLEQLEDDLRKHAAAAFSSEEYQAERRATLEGGQTNQRRLFQELDREARAKGFTVQLTPMGIALVPMTKEGRPATPEEFAQFPDELKRALDERRRSLSGLVQQTLEGAQQVERDAGARLEELDRKVAEFSTSGSFKEVEKEFGQYEEVGDFLKRLREFVLSHMDVIRDGQDGQPSSPMLEAARAARERELLVPFVVNVFVDNSASKGPPIVSESNPTYANLFGRIDRKFLMGAYVTDHTLIKPGAFHQANGGYLVLNMRQVLMAPLVWEAFKRVVKNKEVRLEDPMDAMGLIAPQTLRPEPMPLEVKVVVTGDASLYHLLAAYDEDFWETFKVRADFDYQIPRTLNNLDAYAGFICSACEKNKLKHLDSSGVAKVVEYAARIVSDQTKLSTRFGLLLDVLIEADFWARKDNADVVKAAHVQKALEQKIFRSNLVSERIQELIQEGTLMVDVTNSEVGQVNGLAVFDLGDVSFGKPSRITAKTFLGRGGVISIDREAKMSGKTFDKGLLTISGYLGWMYAQKRPLSISATVSFEQSYEGIDGDSASSTEIYAILSSLSGVPLKQGIAVTGSVNQKGEVQPIGGVNQKVEGHFDVCKAIGLTGKQGVMIPKQNVRNLMLREDLVEAAAQGQFHIYAVGTIAEGVELLTGLPFGERDGQGNFPEGTINHLVEKRLEEFAKAQAAAAKAAGATGQSEQAKENGSARPGA
ncbi:MAG: hypothetical protein FJ039_01225 [Chloroflexi bacterium]|nr:hypothetical protein [Chloroflexota bacterium]